METPPLKDYETNRSEALQEIKSTGHLEIGEDVVKFIDLNPKYLDLKLRGEQLKEFFKLTERLESRFG